MLLRPPWKITTGAVNCVPAEVGLASLTVVTGQRPVKFLYAVILVIFILLSGMPIPAAEGKQDGAEKDFIFLPFAYYTPETKTAFVLTGILTRRESVLALKPSSIMAFLTYTTEDQTAIHIVPEFYTSAGFRMAGGAGYKDFPDKFYGIGPDAEDEDEEEYTEVASSFSAEIQYEILSRFLAGVKYDYEDLGVEDVETGGLLKTGALTGSKGGIVSGGGLVLTYDSRDDIFMPSKGLYAEASALHYSGAFGSDFDFDTTVLDVRQFFGSDSVVVALQEYLHFSGGEPPFQRLAQLGGPNLMRGFFRGKFRDRNMSVFQAETRIPLSAKFGLVFFGSAGKVAPEANDLIRAPYLAAVGTGLRYRVGRKEAINLRADVAFTEDGDTGVYFTIREAF